MNFWYFAMVAAYVALERCESAARAEDEIKWSYAMDIILLAVGEEYYYIYTGEIPQ